MIQGVFQHSRASNSKVNGPNWPKIQLIQDFMVALVNCKFEDDLLKNEGGILRTTFSPL